MTAIWRALSDEEQQAVGAAIARAIDTEAVNKLLPEGISFEDLQAPTFVKVGELR